MAEDQINTTGSPGAAAPAPSAPPTSPPGYALLEEIGHGGMGVVYRARDVTLQRDVAVKLLSDRPSSRRGVIAMRMRYAPVQLV